MQAETIISSSGTKHVVGTPPGEMGGEIRSYVGRTRTLCGMHILNDEEYKPTGVVCEWCRRVTEGKEE
jgi:hypothetical protein